MSATIDRSQPIAVTLTAEQWEMTARVLSNGPYNVVAPLIAAIQQQCMTASARLPMNGADEAPALQRPEV